MSLFEKLVSEGRNVSRPAWLPASLASKSSGLSTLRVTSRLGRHQGASAEIDKPEFSIGRDLENSIVLTDDDIEDTHIIVRRATGGRSGQLAIEAVGPGVLAAMETIDPGEIKYVSLPVEISVGTTRLRIDGTEVGEKRTFFSRELPIALALGAGLGLLISPSSFGVFGSVSNAVSSVSDISIPGMGGTDISTLNSRVAQSPLKDKIQLTSRGNAIVARGTLAPDDYRAWRTLRDQLVKEGLDTNNFVNLVGIASTSTFAPGQIAAVSQLPEPTVIGADGRRAKKGERLTGGWKVLSIGDKKVVLGRGTQTVVVPF